MEDCCFCGILWKVGVAVWYLVAVSISVECQVEGCVSVWFLVGSCSIWYKVRVSDGVW